MSRVYFVQAGNGGPIKIGIARDPAKRMSDLQVANANKLTLLGSIPGDLYDEQSLHQTFQPYRLNGEWFQPAPQVVDWLKTRGMTATVEGRCESCASLAVAMMELKQAVAWYAVRYDHLRCLEMDVRKALAERDDGPAHDDDPRDAYKIYGTSDWRWGDTASLDQLLNEREARRVRTEPA